MADNKKAEKKNIILDTAMALFQKNTVGATAIDDIVKAAGIARGTFYLYFKDKSDLLEQIIMTKSRSAIVSTLNESMEQVDVDGLSFPALAELFLNYFIDFLCNNKDVLTILQKNISAIMKNAPEFGDEEINALFRLVLMKMGDYGYTEEKAIKTVYLVVDMVGSVCSDAILTAKPYPIEEMRPLVLAAAMNILEHGKDDDSQSLQKEANS